MLAENQKWIIDKDFAGLTPFDLFHKEKAAFTKPVHRDDLKNRHMLIRKKFRIGQKPERASILITADDYYKLYINEHYVGQGPAPAYHFRYNMNEYDISDFLRPGENIIAVHVYYQGLLNRVWNSGDYRMGMTARITGDGKTLLVTDDSWKYESAREFIGTKTVGYETQFLEDIDNRKKMNNWKRADFDDSDWKRTGVNENFDYRFSMQTTPGLEVYTIPPAAVKVVGGKKFIVDFGHELTGRLLVSAKGRAGDTIELYFGEELENPETVRSNMRCNCDYSEQWILSGNNDSLEQYDYKAFRYAAIASENADIDISSIRAEVRHYPFDEKKVKFESSNERLAKIWEICKNGVKYGTQEAYLDCPSREKGQYLGDATVTAQSQAYLTGDYRMFKKCLADFAQSARVCPGLMATSPGSFMQEIADFSLQWPLQLMNYYRLSGDVDFLAEMLPTAEGLVHYFKKFTRQDGLVVNFNEKPIIVDWPSNLRDDYDYVLMPKYQDGCNTVLNAFFVGAVKTLNAIKEILRIPYDKNEFGRLRKSFVAAFYNETTKLFVDAEGSGHSSLHANTLPVFYGIVPPDTNEVINLIKRKRFSCGVYFSYFVLKALANAGEYDFMLELLLSEDEHSWGNMLKEGATTCFEAWGKEQKWNTSLCHPWASSPVIIFIEDIVGLKMEEAGWKKVGFDPKCVTAIQSLDLTIPFPEGSVRVRWNNGKTSQEILRNV